MKCVFGGGDRPQFVLDADDKFFVPLVRMWVELVEMDAPEPIPDSLCAAIMEAMEIANRAVAWQKTHAHEVSPGGGGFPGRSSCRAIVAGRRRKQDAVSGP